MLSYTLTLDMRWMHVDNCRSTADWRNQDFWEQILQGVLNFEGSFCVQKVDAHRAKTSASSAQDAFLIQWNSAADATAKAARQFGLSFEQARVYGSFTNTRRWHEYWARCCQDFLLDMAVQAADGSVDCLTESHEVPDESELGLANFEANEGDLIDAFPISWEAAFTATPRLLNFGIDIAISFGRWLLAQARVAHFVVSVAFLELFIGFYYDYDVGAVLPVRVGVHRGRERWTSVANTKRGPAW